MNTIRWVMLLPLALLSGIIGGAAANYFFSFFVNNWMGEEMLWMAWCVSGFASIFLFLGVGLMVSPQRTEKVKKALIVIAALIGVVSLIGNVISNQFNPILSSVVFLYVAWNAWGTDVEDLLFLNKKEG